MYQWVPSRPGGGAPRLRAEAVTTGAADRFWKRSHRPSLVTTYYVCSYDEASNTGQ